MIRLEMPHVRFKQTYLDAVKEFKECGSDNDSTDHYLKHDLADLDANFDRFVHLLWDEHNGVGLKPGRVPGSEYWIIDDEDRYCGRISLRHHLNEQLSDIGGHIGYDVVPSQRGKHYAAKALKLCLKEAKNRGINEVLMTCDDDNLPSIKTIEKNGGCLQDKLKRADGRITRRYRLIL